MHHVSAGEGFPTSLVTYRSAADLATEQIRELIHSDILKAGEKAGIDSLATRLGLSSTPIREALKRLETEGLVEIAPRVGVYVRVIPEAEVREVYALKECLEPLMVQWATLNGSDEEHRDLLRSSEELIRIAQRGDVREYVDLIEARRQAMLISARSAVLGDLLQAIEGRVRLLRHRNLSQPDRMRQSAQEHKRIALAISGRDVELATNLARAHVQSATTSLLKLLDSTENQAVGYRAEATSWGSSRTRRLSSLDKERYK